MHFKFLSLCGLLFSSATAIQQTPLGLRTASDIVTEQSIYETLASNPKFTNVTKALNFVDDVAALLKDRSLNLTFFAVEDGALKPPPHRDLSTVFSQLDDIDVDDFGPSSEEFLRFHNFGTFLRLVDEVEVQNSDDKEKRKKILKFILRILLRYHIVPTTGYDIVSLGRNTTYPTMVSFPIVFDNEPLRLRVKQSIIPPLTTVNFYASIVKPNIFASNGVIHAINHPLLPPPSLFQELYSNPKVFSTFTSALQRSGLTNTLDFRFVKGKGMKGSSLVTVFAPSNHAFDKLPSRLKWFLFSPWGERALSKLLLYHIVPNAAVFTDYVHYGKVRKPQQNQRHLSPSFATGPIFHTNLTLDTLFINHTIDVFVGQHKVTLPLPGRRPSQIVTKLFVNKQRVHVRDIVGLNGALHVVQHLLDPRDSHKDHHRDCCNDDDSTYDWKDWEEWLPQWALEL